LERRIWPASTLVIGYENRILVAEDFNNDRKDAGEIGAGHTVTALYEIVPAGSAAPGAAPAVDDLKYQARLEDATVADDNGELLTLKLRYKQPEGSTSQLLEFPLVDGNRPFFEADRNFQFAAAVAAIGMKLRGSQYAGSITWPAILEIAQAACGADAGGYRTEFVELVRIAAGLAGEGG
jgi:Ca-activated chloride channel family protein